MEELKLSFNPDALDQAKKSDLEQIKDGTSFYRIAPPFGTNNGGFPWAFHGIHFGFYDAQGNQIPVRCSYDREKFCPICEEVWEAEKTLEALGKNAPESETKDLQEFVDKYKVDRGFYVNAITVDGLVKKLKLKPVYITGQRTEKEGELVRKIKEAINDKKFDPLSLDAGAAFKFTRSGKGFGTTYSVDFARTSVKDGNRIIEEIALSAVSDKFPELAAAIKEQLETNGKGPLFDVFTLYPQRSSTELKAYLNGEPVPSQRRSGGSDNQAQELKVGALTPLAPQGQTTAVPEQQAPTAVPVATTQTQVPTAETPAPTQAPVAAAPALTPDAVTTQEAAAPVMTNVPATSTQSETAAQTPASVTDAVANARAKLKALNARSTKR